MYSWFRNAPNEPPETSGEPFGHQAPEMLETSLQRLPGSHLATWLHKCSAWASRGLLGAISPPGSRNAKNEPLEGSWGPFGRLPPEMLKMSLHRSPGNHLTTWLQKLSKYNFILNCSIVIIHNTIIIIII